MNRYSIGVNIQKRRKHLNKTQTDIAKSTGTSKSQISKWENDSVSPSIENFVKISEVLNIKPEALVEGRIEEDNVKNKEQKKRIKKIILVLLVTIILILLLRLIIRICQQFIPQYPEIEYETEIVYKKQLDDGTWEVRQLLNNDKVWVEVEIIQKDGVIIDGKVMEVVDSSGNDDLVYTTDLKTHTNTYAVRVHHTYNEEFIIYIFIVQSVDVD